MFDHFAWSVVVVPLAALAVVWLLGDRLRPDLAAKCFAWSALAVAGAAGLNLVAFALKALAEVPAVADAGGWSREIVVADTAHVPWVSWLSLGWVLVGSGAILVVVRRRRRAVLSGQLEADLIECDQDVVIVPDSRVDAFALPGRPGRIVITTGMRELLDEQQFSVLVAHERAHLDGDHHRLVWMGELAAVIHPLLRPVARKVAFLVERAADESAVAELGDRRQVARAIGAAALAAARPGGSRTAGAHLMAVGSSPGAMPSRVRALLRPGRFGRWQTVVLIVVVVSTVVWTGECLYDLGELLVLAHI